MIAFGVHGLEPSNNAAGTSYFDVLTGFHAP